MLTGIFVGLLCALAHSFSYLASKHHAVRHPRRVLHLLLYGHLLMAIVAVPLTVVLWPRPFPAPGTFIAVLAASALFYGAAQGCMIAAMRHTEPSRVSPLLGVKVLMMGVFVRVFLHTSLSPRQWIALALCTAGALALGFSGTRLRPRAVTFILLAAAGYVASDLFISRLVRLVADSGQPLSSAALFALGITYSALALTSLIGAPFLGGMRELTRHTRDVAPFAALWLLAMAFYYVTLGLVGPVFGVVLQSTRGFFSVMIGGLLQRFGHARTLEIPLTRGIFLCRMLSAILMFVSIVLYAID